MTATVHYLHARPAPRHRINWTKAGWLLFAVAWCGIFWLGVFTLLRGLFS